MITSGISGVYKPKGPSSFRIVSQLRRLTGEKRIGHAGTLDPLADGVLVVGIGRAATKLLATEVAKEKEYLVTIEFGATSTTDDAEGEKTIWSVGKIPTQSQIENILPNYLGQIQQQPPNFSAIQVAGQRAYKLARRGQVPKLGRRTVEIKELELLGYNWPQLTLRVVTGPGVYIRALARDIGEQLQVGGYVSVLTRTRVGEYRLEDCLRLDI